MVFVVDDFLDGAIEREKALASDFEPMSYEGFAYPGISETQDVESVNKISGFCQTPFKSATVLYRYYSKDMKQQGFIHSDASVANYTGIVFLSPPKTDFDGLCLWRHKETGTDSYFGSEDWEKFRDDGFDQTKWHMLEFVPIKMGRLVLFPAMNWHSRYPFEVTETEPKDARLIKVFFCRT